MKKHYTKNPTEPIEIEAGMTTDELLGRMERISFQGRQIARAARVWEIALDQDAYVMMGLAGAMTAAGMRKLVAKLIDYRYIDCLVSTGANLFHDIYETLGTPHFMGSPDADDEALFECGLDRVYDTYADEREFESIDRWIGEWATGSLENRPYTTREFLFELGLEIDKRTGGANKGILTTAAKFRLPIYCPAIADSSIGIGLASAKKNFVFDLTEDVRETGTLVIDKETMVLYCGGGTPKNFIQQTEVTAKHIGGNPKGHRFAVQFVTDAPHWGGLSGCTFDEAVSWGKINPGGDKVTVFCDTTIALPLVASALLTRMRDRRRR
ncbi:MAG: deoxyhypusine synthase family protein [Candidatus Latescibacterota bacterium]|nr:MAG: deoxyhypusine synthase family protein [Candidatus Latescibacterota bacterium]